jgi:hypothetical protein
LRRILAATYRLQLKKPLKKQQQSAPEAAAAAAVGALSPDDAEAVATKIKDLGFTNFD